MMTEMLYISGSGRSGSTLLERILNSSQQFVAVGEFHALWRLPTDEITCSCGKPVGADDYWQSVLSQAAISAADIADLRRLESKVARFGHVSGAGYSLERLRADPDVEAFLAPQFALFDAIARISGKPVVVDSSKAGPRAWLMASDPRTHVLHLYRDPTDVIASWRSKKFDQGLNRAMQRPGVPAAAADWWKSEYLARRLARETAVGMMDYGRLCEKPEAVIDAALAAAGMAGPAGAAWLDAGTVRPGASYHSLNGNPDRFDTGSIRIKARQVDWAKQDALDRVAIPAAGIALRTFYRPTASRAPTAAR